MDQSLKPVGGSGQPKHLYIAAPHRRRTGVLLCLRVALLLLLGLSISGCTAPVQVDWSTETEMDTAGFNVYRGESPDGPFGIKINDKLIPASPDPMTGGKYRYTDSSAQVGRTYYYQLQEVEKNGAVNKYGPIAVRAGGFDPRLALVLGILAAGVLVLWVRGAKRVNPVRQSPRDKQGPPAVQP
jgi:hypothetical protein